MIAALGLLIWLAGPVAAACAEDRVSVRGAWGQAHFSVSVADDVPSRSRGLMHVEDLPVMAGMLFVYDRPQPVNFWMRNTLIPLDMIFADEAGIIQHIHENAEPLDETPIFGGDAIQFVLEINGGLSSRFGMAAGDMLQHPAIGTEAAWACAAE